MYNVKRNPDGLVTVTKVGEEKPTYTLGEDTFITFREPSCELEIKQVKDFIDDVSLLRAIAFSEEI